MIKTPQTFTGSALFALVLALTAWSVQALAQGDAAQKEASVLFEKQAVQSAEGPSLPAPANYEELPPPANQPALPPPARPKAAPATRHSVTIPAKRPFLRPAEPKRAPGATRAELTSDEEPMPAPAPVPGTLVPSGGELVVHPTPPIEYDTDGDARDMYRHFGQVDLVMATLNPADGCAYEIPMCIPACCTGEPTISGGRGIFGRGVVEYCWPCGFRAIVKFRHILGDVKVEYEGD